MKRVAIAPIADFEVINMYLRLLTPTEPLFQETYSTGFNSGGNELKTKLIVDFASLICCSRSFSH